jgi:hypothetical protein
MKVFFTSSSLVWGGEKEANTCALACLTRLGRVKGAGARHRSSPCVGAISFYSFSFWLLGL